MFPYMVYMSSDAASKQIVSAKEERVGKPSEVRGATRAMDPRQKHNQRNRSHVTVVAQQHVGNQQHMGVHRKRAASYWPEDATEPLGGKNKSATQVVCVAADTDLDGTLSDINSISGSSTNPPTPSGNSISRGFFLRLKAIPPKLGEEVRQVSLLGQKVEVCSVNILVTTSDGTLHNCFLALLGLCAM